MKNTTYRPLRFAVVLTAMSASLTAAAKDKEKGNAAPAAQPRVERRVETPPRVERVQPRVETPRVVTPPRIDQPRIVTPKIEQPRIELPRNQIQSQPGIETRSLPRNERRIEPNIPNIPRNDVPRINTPPNQSLNQTIQPNNIPNRFDRNNDGIRDLPKGGTLPNGGATNSPPVNLVPQETQLPRRVDKNGDGRIDATKPPVLPNLGTPNNVGQPNGIGGSLPRRLDKDGDGRMDTPNTVLPNTVLPNTVLPNNGLPNNGLPQNDRLVKPEVVLPRNIDRNRDGKVDAPANSSIPSLGVPVVPGTPDNFRRLDKDGDGKIDPRIPGRLDKDGDGKIDLPNNGQLPNERMNKPDLTPNSLPGRLDKDGDGKIDARIPGKLDKDGDGKPDRLGTPQVINATPQVVNVRIHEQRERLQKELKLDLVKATDLRDSRISPIQIGKNGVLPKLGKDRDVDLNVLRQAKDSLQIQRTLLDVNDRHGGQHGLFSEVDLVRRSGAFQDRLVNQQIRNLNHLERSSIGQRVFLDRQYALYNRGDVARQVGLSLALINAGGWHTRRMGLVSPVYTTSHFSVWYPGYTRLCPRYTWCPRWTRWVDWCWWDRCDPLYDPRPIYCRPVVYQPCGNWTVWSYPVWQPLPSVQYCGTWVDVPPVALENVVNSGIDLQLLAVRFVDGGHPEQNMGPRFRVWIRNNSPLEIQSPFNVTLLAATSGIPAANLPEAGVTIPQIGPGEMRVVDLRLPLESVRMTVEPNGQRSPFTQLHVLVDSGRQLNDINLTNNGTVVPREEILPVDPAAFSVSVTSMAPGGVVEVAGEGFGPEPGQLLVTMNGTELQPEIQGWYDLGVQFKLPGIALANPEDAEVVIVRGDGAASNPVSLRLVPANQLDPVEVGELPPLP